MLLATVTTKLQYADDGDDDWPGQSCVMWMDNQEIQEQQEGIIPRIGLSIRVW
jgi:hypothetical protein